MADWRQKQVDIEHWLHGIESPELSQDSDRELISSSDKSSPISSHQTHTSPSQYIPINETSSIVTTQPLQFSNSSDSVPKPQISQQLLPRVQRSPLPSATRTSKLPQFKPFDSDDNSSGEDDLRIINYRINRPPSCPMIPLSKEKSQDELPYSGFPSVKIRIKSSLLQATKLQESVLSRRKSLSQNNITHLVDKQRKISRERRISKERYCSESDIHKNPEPQTESDTVSSTFTISHSESDPGKVSPGSPSSNAGKENGGSLSSVPGKTGDSLSSSTSKVTGGSLSSTGACGVGSDSSKTDSSPKPQVDPIPIEQKRKRLEKRSTTFMLSPASMDVLETRRREIKLGIGPSNLLSPTSPPPQLSQSGRLARSPSPTRPTSPYQTSIVPKSMSKESSHHTKISTEPRLGISRSKLKQFNLSQQYSFDTTNDEEFNKPARQPKFLKSNVLTGSSGHVRSRSDLSPILPMATLTLPSQALSSTTTDGTNKLYSSQQDLTTQQTTVNKPSRKASIYEQIQLRKADADGSAGKTKVARQDSGLGTLSINS